MNFETWFKELTSDEIWFQQAGMNHKPETFEATARQIWVNGLAEGDSWKLIPMKEHRRHLFNKLSKLPPDRVKKKWWVKEEDKEDVKPAAPPVPRGSAKYMEYTNQILAEIAKSKTVNYYPGKSYSELAEEGGVRRPKDKPYPMTSPAEAYVRQRHLEYVKQNYEPRTGEKMPGWISEEEFNLQYDNSLT